MGLAPKKKRQKMEIKRGAIANALYSLIGDNRTGVAINTKGFVVLGSNPEEIPFTAMAEMSRARTGLFFGTIDLPLMDSTVLRVRGLKTIQVEIFSNALNQAWLETWRSEIDQYIDEIQSLSSMLERLETPRAFPAACLVEPFLQKATALVRSVPMNLPSPAVEPKVRESLVKILEFYHSPERLRDEAIDRFIKNELKAMAPFFKGVEKNPLTLEQQLAVVCDEDATLVLAGAGSGKTSVITAKVVYLVKRGIRKPQEILLMAFGKNAAKEMSERVARRCGASVAAMTFHSLAYGIIAEIEGNAPPLAHHANDDMALYALLRKILLKQIITDPDKRQLLLRWFCKFFAPSKNAWDFETKHDYFNYIEDHEPRTLQGEKVRSFEELEIANWLYINGVVYEYEPTYEYELPDSGRKTYTPDFHLKDSGVYIEHFGVRRQLDSNGNEYLSTAPFVNQEEYLDEMKWKRKVHVDYGTTLIETFSYEKSEGCLTSNLREKLSPYVKFSPLPTENIFDRLKEMGQIDAFTQTLATFLRHFKDSNLSLDQCRYKINDDTENSERSLAFLEIFDFLFTEYQKELGDRIDFEDMITRATRYIKMNRYKSPYRHLLVDEFQDISRGRANLLMALKEQHTDSRIFAVGDDWQSIYRFSGSDIHLMQNFGMIFGGTFAGKKSIHKSVDLGRTFRSVDRIALPARSFVLKNPFQIVKNVTTTHKTTKSAIQIIWSKKRDNMALKEALEHLAKQTKGTQSSILLLGRYNRLHPGRLTDLNNLYPNLSLSFKSIHAAKGLEADHVIILGANSGYFGLPSEIVDDPVLELVFPESKHFEHAEERRVFYVALTRARKSVTIIASDAWPSCFVTELLKHEEYNAMELGEQQHYHQYQCNRCGGQLIQNNKRRFVCEHSNLCDASLPVCPACGTNLPIRSVSKPIINRCECGATFPACPKCVDGWLVKRKGKYGRFFGCVNFPRCRGKKSA